MSSFVNRILKMRISKIWLALSVMVFFSYCGTSLVSLKTDAKTPDTGNAIVIGSFLIDPVPEWTEPDDTFWLSIWREPVPRSEYTISLQPNKEKDILVQLPAGSYEIAAIYEGEQGNWSRGHGRKGGLGFWFEITEGDVLYIGRLHLNISPEPEYIRRQKDGATDLATRLVTKSILGHAMSGKPSRPIMYTEASIENNMQKAVSLLKDNGWSKSDIEKLKKSLITSSAPE